MPRPAPTSTPCPHHGARAFTPRLALALAFALGLAAAGSAGAQGQGQWKWRDSNGRIQFSDRPPPQGTPDQDILIRPAVVLKPIRVVPVNDGTAQARTAAAPGAPAASSPAQLADAAAKARADKAKAEQQRTQDQRDARLRDDNCRQARANVELLQAGTRMVRLNDRGEREALDDAQRAQEMRTARAVIAADCK